MVSPLAPDEHHQRVVGVSRGGGALDAADGAYCDLSAVFDQRLDVLHALALPLAAFHWCGSNSSMRWRGWEWMRAGTSRR